MAKSYEIQTEMFQIVNERGEVDEANFAALNLDDQQLKTMYYWMLRGRTVDKKFLNLQRQGRIGTYGSYLGQEAAQVGSALSQEKDDWVVPSYRESVVTMVHGQELKTLLMSLKGHFGNKGLPNINVWPTQVIIAGQIPHAVGCAWASKLKAESSVTTCYFGDGATSQGDFHEGMNFASVYNLPVVFFCQNNQWAISVPLEKQMASKTIAQKAIAYGMKGVRVDGNDVLACYQVSKEAADRARRGEGPTLIEAVTYRQGSHTTADDWTKYRSKEEVEMWSQQKDPILRFERFLEHRGLFSNDWKESIIAESEADMEAALVEFEALSPPPSYVAFDFVYDKAHPELANQRDELKYRIESSRRDQ